KGLHKNIPYIIGTTAHEYGAERYQKPQSSQDFLVSYKSKFGDRIDDFLEIIGFKDDPNRAILQGGLNDMIQPGVLAWCEHELILKDRAPTWLYYFTRELPGEMPAGAYHSAELWYVFQTVHRCYRPLCGIDFDLSIAMNKMWANFVKNGNPNSKDLPYWETYSTTSRSGMEFGDRLGMIAYPGSARSRFIANITLEQN
ncbi:MAG TPA: carboxylesterase family protein, partial [Clostridiaceae bacterium]|nr:carboxylesterase family protein [Clostridiaceae bacterium]